jgi:hypothetical protein
MVVDAHEGRVMRGWRRKDSVYLSGSGVNDWKLRVEKTASRGLPPTADERLAFDWLSAFDLQTV